MKPFFLLLFSFLLSACDLDLGSHYDPTVETVYVDYYREPCDDSTTELCYRIRFDTDEAFKLTTLPTTGFDSLEWGSRYVIRAEVDYSDRGEEESYTFENIVSVEVMEPVSNDFVLTFYTSSGILQDNSSDASGSSWMIAGETTFTCEETDCAAISAAFNANKLIQLNFQAENDQLTLQAVKCSASEDDFSTECEGIVDESWDIAHYKTDCGLYIPSWCHVYKDTSESSSNWHLLAVDIEDFTYQWGTQYDVDVTVDLSAGSLSAAKLINVNDSDEITDSFKTVIRFDAESSDSDAGILTYQGVFFDCDRYSLCDDIDEIIDDLEETEERIVVLEGALEDDGSTSTTFIVEELVCDSDSSTFKENCADSDDEVYWVNND